MFSRGKISSLPILSALEVISGITYIVLPHFIFPISNVKKNYCFCFYEQKEKISFLQTKSEIFN